MHKNESGFGPSPNLKESSILISGKVTLSNNLHMTGRDTEGHEVPPESPKLNQGQELYCNHYH